MRCIQAFSTSNPYFRSTPSAMACTYGFCSLSFLFIQTARNKTSQLPKFSSKGEPRYWPTELRISVSGAGSVRSFLGKFILNSLQISKTVHNASLFFAVCLCCVMLHLMSCLPMAWYPPYLQSGYIYIYTWVLTRWLRLLHVKDSICKEFPYVCPSLLWMQDTEFVK